MDGVPGWNAKLAASRSFHCAKLVFLGRLIKSFVPRDGLVVDQIVAEAQLRPSIFSTVFAF